MDRCLGLTPIDWNPGEVCNCKPQTLNRELVYEILVMTWIMNGINMARAWLFHRVFFFGGGGLGPSQ